MAHRQAVPAKRGGHTANDVGRRIAAGFDLQPQRSGQRNRAKRLADTVYSYQLSGGTIGNTHFLAIPFNAKAKEGAQVVANFLLTPLAQARKADITQWGDPTVLALDKLPAGERAYFGNTNLPGQVEQAHPPFRSPTAAGSTRSKRNGSSATVEKGEI